jgi:hypothetical protein
LHEQKYFRGDAFPAIGDRHSVTKRVIEIEKMLALEFPSDGFF